MENEEVKEQVLDANDVIDQKLSLNRREWEKKITDVINDMRDMPNLTDVHVRMLSYRHQLVDQIADFQNKLSKVLYSYELKYKDRFLYYTTAYDVKLTSSEKEKFIRTDLGKTKIQIQKFEIHVDFYKDCIKTLDNLGFALKSRMKLHEDGF
jgi:hypothetical protein